MSPERADWWKKTRKKGSIFFVVHYGGLRWGIPMGIIAWFVKCLANEQIRLQEFPFDVGTFMLGGILCGLIVWRTNERAYHGGRRRRR